MLPFFTILHLLVDACSETVLVVGGMTWQWVFMYNALAFELQFPLGVALDTRPRLVKGAFVASLALTLAGVGVCSRRGRRRGRRRYADCVGACVCGECAVPSFGGEDGARCA